MRRDPTRRKPGEPCSPAPPARRARPSPIPGGFPHPPSERIRVATANPAEGTGPNPFPRTRLTSVPPLPMAGVATAGQERDPTREEHASLWQGTSALFPAPSTVIRPKGTSARSLGFLHRNPAQGHHRPVSLDASTAPAGRRPRLPAPTRPRGPSALLDFPCPGQDRTRCYMRSRRGTGRGLGEGPRSAGADASAHAAPGPARLPARAGRPRSAAARWTVVRGGGRNPFGTRATSHNGARYDDVAPFRLARHVLT